MNGPSAFKRMVDDTDEHVLLEFSNNSNSVDPADSSEPQSTGEVNVGNIGKELIEV